MRDLPNTLANKISQSKQLSLLGTTFMYYLNYTSPILPTIITHQKALTKPKTQKGMDKLLH